MTESPSKSTKKKRTGKADKPSEKGKIVHSSPISESTPVKAGDNYVECVCNVKAKEQVAENSTESLLPGLAPKDKVRVQNVHTGTEVQSVPMEDVVELHPNDTSLLG